MNSEQYFTVKPADGAARLAVLRQAREDGFLAEIRNQGCLMIIIPGQHTGWNDRGREQHYRLLAGDLR